MMQDSKAGIYYDILQKISERSDFKFEIEFASSSRSNALFEQGSIDIEPGVNPIWRQHSKLVGDYSIPFTKSEDIVLFKSRDLLNPPSLENLAGKRIGGIRGFTYPMFSDSFSNGTIERVDLKDGPSLFKFFIAGRVDYIIINKIVAAYWILNHPDYQYLSLPDYLQGKLNSDDANGSILIGSIISSADLMLRVHPSKKHVLQQLNSIITELITEGEIEGILARYR
jgi:polar amino acid transport system substrate-binding protein